MREHKKAPGQWPGAFSRFYSFRVARMTSINPQGTRTIGDHLTSIQASSSPDTTANTSSVHHTANMDARITATLLVFLLAIRYPRCLSLPLTIGPSADQLRMTPLDIPARLVLRHFRRIHNQPPDRTSSRSSGALIGFGSTRFGSCNVSCGNAGV